MNFENLMTVDYVLFVVVGLSAFVGLWRGLIKETFSLVTWVAAIGLAITFREIPAQILQPMVGNEMVSVALGALIIFVLTMLIGGTIASILKKVITKSNLGFINRILGLIFGIARALVIIVGLSIMINFGLSMFSKNLDDFAWWNESQITPYVEQFEDKAFNRMMQQYQEREKSEENANEAKDKPESDAEVDSVPGDDKSTVLEAILKSAID